MYRAVWSKAYVCSRFIAGIGVRIPLRARMLVSFVCCVLCRLQTP